MHSVQFCLILLYSMFFVVSYVIPIACAVICMIACMHGLRCPYGAAIMWKLLNAHLFNMFRSMVATAAEYLFMYICTMSVLITNLCVCC